MDTKSWNNQPITPDLPDGLTTPTGGMSARQLNVLKRKMKSSKAQAANKYNLVRDIN